MDGFSSHSRSRPRRLSVSALLRRLQLLSLLSSLLAFSAASLPADAATASARFSRGDSGGADRHNVGNTFSTVTAAGELAALSRRRTARLLNPHNWKAAGGGASLASSTSSSSSLAVALPFRGRLMAGESSKDELAHINAGSLKPTAGSNTYEIGGKSTDFNRLTNHGGRILSGSVPVYLVYYGDWAGDKGQGIMEAFINSINNTAADTKGVSVREWFNLHSHYHASNGADAATNIYLAGTRTVTSSNDLPTDASVADVVRNLQSSGSLPYNSNALFAVLTSSGIQQDGFCNSYCGWHTSVAALKGSTSVNVIFVGWGGDCSGCAPYSTSTNGNPSMDGMVNVMAHEITESVTDVDGNGFSDSSSGEENADACAWHFLKLPSSNEPYYNTYGINGYKFLLQANIDPSTNDCVHGLESSAPAAPPPPPNAQCSASSNIGSKCTCPAGKASKDGCVCSKGACVSLCSAYSGTRCRACNRFFCTCKRGKCMPGLF